MKNCICLFCFLCLFSSLFGQQISDDFNLEDTTQLHVLETKRGDRFIGRVERIQNTQIFFLFRNNQQLEFQLNEIERISVYDPNRKPGDPEKEFAPSFMVLVPTAFNLKKGEFEYQNVDLAWNTLNYGVSDYFSIGGGFIIPVAFVMRLRASTPVSEKVHVGFNTLTVVPLSSGTEPLTVATLNTSIGNPNQFLNLGIGYAFEWGFPGDPGVVFSLGGAGRIGPRIGINGSINFFTVDGSDYFFTNAGVNYFGKKNRIGLGILIDTSEEILGLFGIPVVSLTQRF